MNRRHLVTALLAAGSMPVLAVAQTPLASPEMDESTVVDTRARDLVGLLRTISPVELIQALQETPVEQDVITDPQVTPWVDFGDTDLHSSLGGAVILSGSGDINEADADMIGAYIVYESAEIAYQEFVRKLGPAYDIPSTTMSAAGTTVWELANDTLRLGVARIGYVMIVANMTEVSGPGAVEAMIDHLMYVAARVDA